MSDIGDKLRKLRKRGGLSLRDLAARANVSASLLSQIENGKVTPSVMSLYSIAEALKTPVSAFFPEVTPYELANYAPTLQRTLPFSPSQMRDAALNGTAERDAIFASDPCKGNCMIMRRVDRPTIGLMHGVTWARLTQNPEPNAEFLEITYVPGASSGPALSHHNGREFGLILEGELLLELGFDLYTLRAGDSIIFDSQTPHRLNNRGAKPMRAIWIVFTPDHPNERQAAQ